MDRYDHFASPHNRVCQNMTFRWLCGDPNISFPSEILEIAPILLDLLAITKSLKDPRRILKHEVKCFFQATNRSESKIWANPRIAKCKINQSTTWWGAYAMHIVFDSTQAHQSPKGRKIPQKAPKNKIFVVFSTSTCEISKLTLDIKILLPLPPGHSVSTSPNARVC